MRNEVVVGINNSFFEEFNDYTSDGSISIMVNGELQASVAQERITRIKYDGRFEEGLTFLLKKLKISKDSVDRVSLVGFAQDIKKPNEKIFEDIYNYFNRKIPINYIYSHHEAHAWSGIAQSGFKTSLIAVLDHTGSILNYGENRLLDKSACEQTSYYIWDNNKLKLIDSDHNYFSDLGYGRFYSKVTRYIGFNSYHYAGKTMGLAPINYYNDEIDCEKAYHNIDGYEKTNITHAKYSLDGLRDLEIWFENKFELEPLNFTKKLFLANWAQRSIETSVLRKLKLLLKRYPVDNLIIVGGVALNSVMNGFLEKELGINIFIPSSPGDAGLSYGALAYDKFLQTRNPFFSKTPYLGIEYSDEEILEELKKSKLIFKKLNQRESDIADMLVDNKIVAIFSGRSEFGPRALGNRSIIASPKNPWIKEIINGVVKRREWFRPFAPSVLKDDIFEWFDCDTKQFDYMMKTVIAKEEKRKMIPSVIHNDGSSRIQSVSKEENLNFFNIIKSFKNKTGIPMVLNTSFNLGGMPLVETPKDAIECFVKSEGINYLIIEDYLIKKV